MAIALPHQESTVGSEGGRTGFASDFRRVLPLVILIYSFLLTAPEVRLEIAGQNLPAYRLTIIALLWVPVYRAYRRTLFLSFVDLCVATSAVWTIVSFSKNYGFAEGIPSAFGSVVDIAGAYFIGRSCVERPRDLRVLFLCLLPALLLVGFEMVVESVGRRFIVRPFWADVFGGIATYDEGALRGETRFRTDYRLGGLLRSMGPFSHPILGGTIMVSTLAMYLTGGFRRHIQIAGIAASLGGFFALSSATIMALLLIIVTYVIDYFLVYIRKVNWAIVSGFLVVSGLVLQLVSQNGLVNFLIRQTLNPHNGYYRLLIWEYGLLSVENNPLYGIGYRQYERPLNILPSGSVDAHFLALAMANGIVASLALLLGVIVCMVKLGRAMGPERSPDRMLLLGLNIMLFALFFSSLTVTFFGEARVWFMAVIGMTATLGQLHVVRPPVSRALASKAGAVAAH